jgi:hypothetical protein
MNFRITGARLAGRVVAFTLVAACGAAAVSAQSLGELARREEARRKAIKAAAKVYTNDNVRSEPAPRGTTPAAGAPAAAAPGTPATPPTPSGVDPAAAGAAGADKANATPGAQTPAADAKPDEKAWRARVQAARDALARAQTFAEALQSRINALSADFAARDDPAQRATVSTDRQKALAELDRVKGEIEQHTKAIAAIQDEARKAGVPPGWVR